MIFTRWLCQSQTINHSTRHCVNKLCLKCAQTFCVQWPTAMPWWDWWSKIENCKTQSFLLLYWAFEKCWFIIKVNAIEKCEKNRFDTKYLIIILFFLSFSMLFVALWKHLKYIYKSPASRWIITFCAKPFYFILKADKSETRSEHPWIEFGTHQIHYFVSIYLSSKMHKFPTICYPM